MFYCEERLKELIVQLHLVIVIFVVVRKFTSRNVPLLFSIPYENKDRKKKHGIGIWIRTAYDSFYGSSSTKAYRQQEGRRKEKKKTQQIGENCNSTAA